MKIAIDARIIYTSTGRYVERLLNCLQSIDHANDYVVLLWRKDFERWQPTAPNFTKVVADYPSYSLSEQVVFARQLNRLKIDLVHFTMPQFPLAYRRPFVVTIHDLTLVDFVNRRNDKYLKAFYKQTVKPAVFKSAIKQAARRSAVVITPTNYVKNQIVKRLGRSSDDVIVTYEGADFATAKPLTYSGLTKDFILYVGNAYPYKNLQRLIDAFHAMKREGLELVLVGKKDYFYEELERYVKRQQIEGVVFTGFVPDEQLAWLYQQTKAYVFPSLSEGFGLPGLEAMAQGTPVVAAEATCLPEVYGDAAHYFDPLDVKDMADKIGEVLDNAKLQAELRRAGTERLKHYSWAKMAQETLNVYRAALEAK